MTRTKHPATIQKLKTLPVKSSVHEQVAAAARERGMTIQGLTERILIAWCNEKKIANNVAPNNI